MKHFDTAVTAIFNQNFSIFLSCLTNQRTYLHNAPLKVRTLNSSKGLENASNFLMATTEFPDIFIYAINYMSKDESTRLFILTCRISKILKRTPCTTCIIG